MRHMPRDETLPWEETQTKRRDRCQEKRHTPREETEIERRDTYQEKWHKLREETHAKRSNTHQVKRHIPREKTDSKEMSLSMCISKTAHFDLFRWDGHGHTHFICLLISSSIHCPERWTCQILERTLLERWTWTHTHEYASDLSAVLHELLDDFHHNTDACVFTWSFRRP
jgi:hypothetical protein